jgi:hypothetical protein
MKPLHRVLLCAALASGCVATQEASLGARRSSAEPDTGAPELVPDEGPAPADEPSPADAAAPGLDANLETLDAAVPVPVLVPRDAEAGALDAQLDSSLVDAHATHDDREEEEEGRDHH